MMVFFKGLAPNRRDKNASRPHRVTLTLQSDNSHLLMTPVIVKTLHGFSGPPTPADGWTVLTGLARTGEMVGSVFQPPL